MVGGWVAASPALSSTPHSSMQAGQTRSTFNSNPHLAQRSEVLAEFMTRSISVLIVSYRKSGGGLRSWREKSVNNRLHLPRSTPEHRRQVAKLFIHFRRGRHSLGDLSPEQFPITLAQPVRG